MYLRWVWRGGSTAGRFPGTCESRYPSDSFLRSLSFAGAQILICRRCSSISVCCLDFLHSSMYYIVVMWRRRWCWWIGWSGVDEAWWWCTWFWEEKKGAAFNANPTLRRVHRACGLTWNVRRASFNSIAAFWLLFVVRLSFCTVVHFARGWRGLSFSAPFGCCSWCSYLRFELDTHFAVLLHCTLRFGCSKKWIHLIKKEKKFGLTGFVVLVIG